MRKNDFIYDIDELDILNNIDDAKSILKNEDKEKYAQFARHTKSLHKKKPVLFDLV